MIKNNAKIIKEIYKEINKANLPVKIKVSFGEAIEGADIGLKVEVEGKKNWELHKKLNSIIRRLLRKKGLVAYIDWHYNVNKYYLKNSAIIKNKESYI
jgi:hypothetical protein